MPHDQKLAAVKKKIQELVPYARDGKEIEFLSGGSVYITPPISLADVLRAFQGNEKAPIGVDMNGYFLDCDLDMTKIEILETSWNLALPLDNQSEPTISFLYDILIGDNK